MSHIGATSPAAEETAVSEAPEVENTTQPEAIESDQDTDENGEELSPPAPVDDTEEVDYEGQKVRVPKLIKDALLRHADYTRKTQELSEQRKAFEAQRETSLAADKDYVEAIATVKSFDAQLARYENVDWATLEAQDPAAAQQHWRIFSQLKDGRSNAEKSANEAQQRNALESQRTRATRAQEVQTQLQKILPEWAPNNDLDRKLANYGTANGLSAQDMADATLRNPSFVAALNKARLWDEHTKKQATQKRIEAAQAATPATEIGAKAPASKNPDRMSTEEWMKYEANRLAKRAGR